MKEKRVRFQLLATGEGLRRDETFAPRHALAMMLRAISRSEYTGEIIIHVLDRSINEELRRGRLSVNEHLSSGDIRYWVAVQYDDGSTIRFVDLATEKGCRTIGQLARTLGVPEHGTFQVWPSWRLAAPGTVADWADCKLVEVVVPESMLRFEASTMMKKGLI